MKKIVHDDKEVSHKYFHVIQSYAACFSFLFSSTHNIMTPFSFFLDFTFVNGMRCGVLWQQRTNKECRKLYAEKKVGEKQKSWKTFFMLTLLPQSK